MYEDIEMEDCTKEDKEEDKKQVFTGKKIINILLKRSYISFN